MNFLRKQPEVENKKTWLIVLSDTHGGHKKGLLNPDVKLMVIDADGTERTYTPNLLPDQEKLWYEVYLPALESIKELTGDNDKVVLHNGDPTWGDKYIDQIMELSQDNQVVIASENFAPLLELPGVKVFRLASSTPSHVFYESSADRSIARNLQFKYPQVDVKLVDHGLANVSGINVDYAHHGPYPGSRIWLKGNEVRYYLRDLMMRHLISGKNPPDLIIRSDFHEYVEESLTIRANGNIYRSHIIITPPLMMMNDYARVRTRSADTISVGLVAIEIRDGRLIWPPYDFMKSYDMRTKETL